MSDPAAGVSALQWSVTAMSDLAERLPSVGSWDRQRGFAVVGETVWRVTIVDATLVRYHHDAYDRVLAGQGPAERRVTRGTMAGLRFVRNRMRDEADYAGFVCPGAGGPGLGDGPVSAWTWKSVPEPALTSLLPRGQAWEMSRYRAYQAHLAGHPIREVFGRATAFLRLAAAGAASAADASAPAPR